VVVGFTIAVTLEPEVQLKDAAFGALVAAFPNTGFMGVPLLVALLGPAAAGPVICTITGRPVRHQLVCIALAAGAGRRGQGLWRARGARACAGAVKNPLPWSIAPAPPSRPLG
jgi:malonate transporter